MRLLSASVVHCIRVLRLIRKTASQLNREIHDECMILSEMTNLVMTLCAGAAGQGIMGGADDAALSMTVVSTILAVLAAEELSAAASKHADDSSPPDADNCPLGSIAPAEQRSPELVALDVAPLAPHQQSAPASAAQMSAEADIAAPKQHSGGMTPLPVAWMPPDSNGPMSKATGDASGAVATPAAVAPAVADTSTVAASPFAAAHLSLPAEEVPQLTAAQQTPTEAAASGERPPSSAASEGIAGMADHFQGGSGGSKPPLQGGSEQGAERQPSAGRLPRLAGALAAMSPPSIAGMRASATSAASSAGAAAARLPSLRSLFVRTTSSKQTMAGPPDASPNGDAHTAGPQDPPPLDGLSSLSGDYRLLEGTTPCVPAVSCLFWSDIYTNVSQQVVANPLLRVNLGSQQ